MFARRFLVLLAVFGFPSLLMAQEKPKLGILVVQGEGGVVVSSVARGTLAAVMNFAEGDQFVTVNSNNIVRAADLNDLLAVKAGTYSIQVKTKSGRIKWIEGEIRKSAKDENRLFFVPKK
jgi:hypothetical protein